MRLLIIRHAAAVPHGTPGIADDERPLTPKGEAKFRVAARGLARIVERPDVLLTSPLPRASATPGRTPRAFQRIEPRVEPARAHGGVDAILTALHQQPREAMVTIVGHEPVLGALVGRLLGAPDDGQFPFKKGGAALLELPEGPSGHARLIW